MSYCVNPSCTQPKNPNNVVVCQACGSKLILSDRYQILGILGKGGFGATFVAINRSGDDKTPCVVKQLRPASNDPGVYKMAKELFEREAQTLDRVGDHPQVPKLLDYFEDNQQFYLVQEYVKGHNLHQEVKRNGPFSEAGVRQFLSEILPILKYIHSQKMIHRDIKPANLIRRETDRKLVLIDFGAVKNQVNTVVSNNASSQTALTAFAVGTAGFAPAEQMAMRPVYASDIYAVGVTCIYLLTAKSPKDLGCDASTGEILWEKYVSVSQSFAQVLKTMLEVSVRHRYKSADEVLQVLELLPYAESLEQSLITAPIPTDKDTGSSHLHHSQTFNGSYSQFSTPATSKIARRNRPRQTPPTTPAGEILNGTVGYQISQTQASQLRNNEASQIKNKATPRLDVKAIKDSYEKGKRDFGQQELNYLNLSKINLSGSNFYQSQLIGVNFQGSDLSNADFGRANLTLAIFRNANLFKAYLGYADLESADLRGADLTCAHLRYANLRGANLCGANLTNAQMTEEQLVLAKTNWLTVMPSGKRGFW